MLLPYNGVSLACCCRDSGERQHQDELAGKAQSGHRPDPCVGCAKYVAAHNIDKALLRQYLVAQLDKAKQLTEDEKRRAVKVTKSTP